MLIFENVSKKFGSFTVLENINFSVNSGEFVSIIGPSGAGKSTMINLLLGFEKSTKGKVKIDDMNLNSLDTRSLQLYRRNIGVVFQDYKLLPQKTIYENIAYALHVCAYPKEKINGRVLELLAQVDLLEKRDSFPNHLSGGEQQRVSIARALINKPRLFIADEPTGNLDPKTSWEIISLLQDISNTGSTVILTTHDQTIVDRLNKRVIRLDRGHIVSDQ
ncbi:MAG: ATP-binding cassette domain-containing protein [Patescibacteria group bacterium]|nr:ATP-binding cassette domain-containing protein [Patescibacteria group bacterium]